MPEWDREDGYAIDFEDSTAMLDDRLWSIRVYHVPFSWHLFTMWWIARRYLVPRDVRRR